MKVAAYNQNKHKQNKGRPLAWTSLLLLLIIGASSCNSGKQYDLYNAGNLDYLSIQYDSALASYNGALEVDKAFYPAQGNRGNVKFRMALEDSANLDFIAAMEADANMTEPWFNQGKVLQRQGKYEEAIAHYTVAINRLASWFPSYGTPEVSTSFTVPGPVVIRDLKVSQAALVNGYFSRGICLQQMNLLDESIADFNRALERDTSYIEAYLQRGNTYLRKAQIANSVASDPLYQQALKDYYRASLLDSLDQFKDKIQFARGNCQLGLQNFSLALLTFDSLVAQDTLNALYHYRQGNALQALAEYHGAYESYSKTITLAPKMPGPFFNRGNCMWVMNDSQNTTLADATADYSEAIKLAPEYANAYYMRGISRVALGDTEGGISDLTQAGDLGHPLGYQEVGLIQQDSTQNASIGT